MNRNSYARKVSCLHVLSVLRRIEKRNAKEIYVLCTESLFCVLVIICFLVHEGTAHLLHYSLRKINDMH